VASGAASLEAEFECRQNGRKNVFEYLQKITMDPHILVHVLLVSGMMGIQVKNVYV